MLKIVSIYSKIAGVVSALYAGGIITTTVRDEKKLEFVKKYPVSSVGGGIFGAWAGGLLFPYTLQSSEKQVYLFGGFPFNGLQMNINENIENYSINISIIDKYMVSFQKPIIFIKDPITYNNLLNYLNDYEKAFPEMKDKK